MLDPRMAQSSSLPVFYINLASRPDRREFMEAQFAHLGIAAERIEATTIAEVPPALVASHADRRTIWPIAAGDIACTLSHQSIWLLMLERQLPAALILEDDAVLTDSVMAFLEADVLSRHRADIIKLETRGHAITMGEPRASKAGMQLRELQSSHMGTAAYIASDKFARQSLDHPLLSRMSVDRFMFGKGGLHLLNSRILQVAPSPVVQLDRLGPRTATRPSAAQSDLTAPRSNRERQRSMPNLVELLAVNATHTARLIGAAIHDPGIIGRKRQRVRFVGEGEPIAVSSTTSN